jgi:hypothetical protein
MLNEQILKIENKNFSVNTLVTKIQTPRAPFQKSGTSIVDKMAPSHVKFGAQFPALIQLNASYHYHYFVYF